MTVPIFTAGLSKKAIVRFLPGGYSHGQGAILMGRSITLDKYSWLMIFGLPMLVLAVVLIVTFFNMRGPLKNLATCPASRPATSAAVDSK